MIMYSKSDIAKYYELSESQYKRIWDLDKSRSLHYGYWNAHTKNFREALLNINKVLSLKARISKNDRVLDAGCGVGGSSFWLATSIGCEVIGISLSLKQVDNANNFCSDKFPGGLIRFEQQDFTCTSFDDNSFDVVWGIESVCHAHRKKDFINEAFRILKPGGRLIIADFFKKPGLAGADSDLVKRWANGWAVDDFATIEEFRADMNNAGFSNIDIENATKNIERSAKRLSRSYLPGKIAAHIYNLFHPHATGIGLKNLDTAKTQFEALKKGLWEYQIVLGSKNHSSFPTFPPPPAK